MEFWGAKPKYQRPTLRLFLSADIVGSTALKQDVIQTDGLPIPDNSRWFEIIQGFYLRSVQEFFREWDAMAAPRGRQKRVVGDRPVLWKTIGDEILFWKEVDEYRQVLWTMNAWMKAVAAVRVFLQEQNPRLDLKCTAWLAHFPWRNKMLISSPSGFTGGESDGVPDSNMQLLQAYSDDPDRARWRVDFAGPAIDVGFRLTAMATHRKFVVGMDVAYLLALAASASRERLPVHYDGLHQFKGVLGGLNYPVFWIDMSSGNAVDVFERDLSRREACRMIDVRDFCEAFYEERSNYLYRPFIVSEHERDLVDRPKWYDAAHMAMINQSLPTPPGH